jgi:hypothetical protein
MDADGREWTEKCLKTVCCGVFADVSGRLRRCEWWAHQDLNLEPTNYEFAALTS